MQCSGPAIARIPKMLWCFTSTSANLPFPQRFLLVTAPKLVIKTMNLITFRVTFFVAFYIIIITIQNNYQLPLCPPHKQAAVVATCRDDVLVFRGKLDVGHVRGVPNLFRPRARLPARELE